MNEPSLRKIFADMVTVISDIGRPGSSRSNTGGGIEVNSRDKAAQPTQEGPDTRRLRSWMPVKKVNESALNSSLAVTLVAVFFVSIFLFAVSMMPESPHLWLFQMGSTLASAVLGFGLSNWWAEWRRGDQRRSSASKIDDEIEEEIQWISENLQQTINSITVLEQDADPQFLRAVRFMLGSQLHSVRSRIRKSALAIDRLGYNSGDFLAEKHQRFIVMGRQVDAIVNSLPRNSQKPELRSIVDNLRAGVDEQDRIPISSSLNADETETHKSTSGQHDEQV